jgi:NDP-sugar pyrophosphorylase family protein
MISSSLTERISTVAGHALHTPRALVLAAGEGTRLRPLTLDRPKPMVPINGKPLLEHTLKWLRGYGIQDVAINLHYRPEVIPHYFGDGSALDLRITYSYEDTILGTAGAVRKMDGFLNGGPLVVVYGDVLTDLDLDALLDVHVQTIMRDPSAGVTMSLYHVPNPTEVGMVGLDDHGRVTCFVEKPKPEEVFTDLANTGVLVIEPDVVDHIPPNTFYDFGLHLFPQLLKSGVSMYGWVIPDETYLLDIGTPEKYAQAQREWPQRCSKCSSLPSF